MKQQLTGLLLSFALLPFLFGCNQIGPAVQNPANRAEDSISKSFLTAPLKSAADSSLKIDKSKISLLKTALEKEFLLQTNLVSQTMNPSFRGLKSRVVFFRKVENKIVMIEASQGLLAAKNYPQVLPIAEFSILSENESEVSFDFNLGMSRLFTMGDWHTTDFNGSRPVLEYHSIKAAFSYIDKALLVADRFLEIHQIAQLETQGNDGNYSNMPVEVVYYLSPYAPNPQFVPQRAPKTMDRFGFFEVNPQFNNEGGSITYAAKMDIGKPVVFAISANTPAPYKDAIRDGVLYWNKAFGRAVMQVVDAPAGVVAPNPNINIIQWVDYDSAGFAYADAQMDPRTGEVLHQQIYLPSAFAKFARREAFDFAKIQPKRKIGLAGFAESGLCDLDLDEHGIDSIAGAADDLTPEHLQKVASDYLRLIVAHEVGHTLGLRHNFAGSLAANYQLDERESLFTEYLNKGSVPDSMIFTSSVMDYLPRYEDIWSGNQISRGKLNAEYDSKAIEFLYTGKHFRSDETPLFCTDSHVDTYVDCRRGDAGNSFVAWQKYSTRRVMERLPKLLLQKFIEAKAPNFGEEAIDVTQVSIDPAVTAHEMLLAEPDLLSLLGKSGRLLSTERSFATVSELNTDEARAKAVEFAFADLNKNGGFEAVLYNPSKDNSPELLRQFELLLNNPALLHGNTEDGKAYEFSVQDIVSMKATAKKFFSRLQEELIKSDVNLLATGMIWNAPALNPNDEQEAQHLPAKFDDTPLASAYARYLLARMADYLLATSGEAKIYKHNMISEWSGGATTSQNESKTYTLAHFKYSFDQRKKAALFLNSARAEKPDWGFTERNEMKKALKAFTEHSVPGLTTGDTAALQNAPEGIISWVVEMAKILALIE